MIEILNLKNNKKCFNNQQESKLTKYKINKINNGKKSRKKH